jgi:multicomponent Na+:H+ antiporter subunit C
VETLEFIVSKYNYWIYITLMMIGFYAMIAKRNLVKKLVGMNIFQTAIILLERLNTRLTPPSI